MATKQGMMLFTLSLALLACAEQTAQVKTFVLAPQPPLTALPDADDFPELEAEVDRMGAELARTLGYGGYDISAVLPKASAWRYVRDGRLQVVVRRETPLGVALKERADRARCLYLEPTVVQDRIGASDWGPLRLAPNRYSARRLDCALLEGGVLASR